VLCIVGAADKGLLCSPPEGLEIISLAARFGGNRARQETCELIADVTGEALPRYCP
jgi:hypothetical protein